MSENKPYYHKTTGERLGVILDVIVSQSSGKEYEIRHADSTDAIYCQCRDNDKICMGWLQTKNRLAKKEDLSEVICKHITEYRKKETALPIPAMNFEQFASVRRGIQLKVSNKTVGDDVKVKRGGI